MDEDIIETLKVTALVAVAIVLFAVLVVIATSH
jgi:hypothetical protein